MELWGGSSQAAGTHSRGGRTWLLPLGSGMHSRPPHRAVKASRGLVVRGHEERPLPSVVPRAGWGETSGSPGPH